MLINNNAAWYRDCRLDKLTQAKLEDTLLVHGYFAEANVLPPIYELEKRDGITDNIKRDPLVMHIPKGKNEWRDFTLLHPQNYGNVVELLCENITPITEHLRKNQSIVSYSVPVAFTSPGERAGLQIAAWNEMQKHLVEASGLKKLNTLVQLDIQRCYHVLYTHTLEWALKDVGDGRLGDELDIALRRGNLNRTHGLAVGPYASDVAAELILSKVDQLIEEVCFAIESLGFRFKDNYYFLCKNESDAEKIISNVAAVLRSYHLTLNDSKSKITNFTDYMISMWQVEHNFIGETVGINEKKLTNTQLKLYLSKSIILSKTFKNEKNILEKTISKIMECELTGFIDYKWLFYTLSNSLYLRSLSYPKLINYMKKLAVENPVMLNPEYKLFMQSEVESADDNKDLYRLSWLGYILKDYDDEFTLQLIKDKLAKYIEHPFIAKLLAYLNNEEIDGLWATDSGRIAFRKKPYLHHIELNDYLAISFAES